MFNGLHTDTLVKSRQKEPDQAPPIDIVQTAETLLKRHTARRRDRQPMDAAESFWGTRLRFCLSQIRDGAAAEYLQELAQAVRVYERVTAPAVSSK